MASKINDRWLWLGFGAFTLISTPLVIAALHHLRSSVQAAPPQQSPKPATLGLQQPARPPLGADSLSLSTLTTLASPSTNPHNPHLLHSTTVILCHRFLSSTSATVALLEDLSSKDPDRALAASSALDLLASHVPPRHFRKCIWATVARLGAGEDFSVQLRQLFNEWDEQDRWDVEQAWTNGVEEVTETDVDDDIDTDDVSPGEPASMTSDVERGDTNSRSNGSLGRESPQEARRRRREAIVVGEGDGGEADVWMRDRRGVVRHSRVSGAM